MPQHQMEIYRQPEAYKVGWTHGFYDAKSDDGAFYGNSNEIGHASSVSADPNAAQLYYQGYLNGKLTRTLREQIRCGITPNTELQEGPSGAELVAEPTCPEAGFPTPAAYLDGSEFSIKESLDDLALTSGSKLLPLDSR